MDFWEEEEERGIWMMMEDTDLCNGTRNDVAKFFLLVLFPGCIHHLLLNC